MSKKERIAYFHHNELGNFVYNVGHPMKPQRLRLTHNLVLAYQLYQSLEVYKPHKATHEDLMQFHSKEYVDFLRRINFGLDDTAENEMQQFQLSFLEDNPAFDCIYDYCQLYSGASMDAASRLNQGLNDICVNWSGGLHHGKKGVASGFCYVNDIVLAILELLKVYPRVMYIDIDIHHGDGVEEAFYTTNRVMTVSFHKYGNFFPGTGNVDEVGEAKGKNYAVNIPLKDGMDDASYKYIFEPVISKCVEVFQPNAIVLQCGADSVTGDRLGTFNLTLNGHAACVDFVRNLRIPLLVLGGGGYTIKNVARTWAFETSVLLNKSLDDNIPYNSFIEWYAPTYKLHIPAGTIANANPRETLDKMRESVFTHLKEIEAVPSVQMQRTPRVRVIEKEDEMMPEERENKDGINSTVRHESEFYDTPRDIDHGENA